MSSPGPDWMEVRILVPPSGDAGHAMLRDIVERYGFVVVDWCLWERPGDKARLTIGPIPPPPPHGFDS
jgi:hypothetical protein